MEAVKLKEKLLIFLEREMSLIMRSVKILRGRDDRGKRESEHINGVSEILKR